MLPTQAGELERLALRLGVSLFDTAVTKHGQTGTDTNEVQRRIREELRSRRDGLLAIVSAVSTIAALLAAVAAGWAAFETRNTAHETSRATRASVWIQISTEYASPDMFTSMTRLRAWQQEHPKDFVGLYRKSLARTSPSKKDALLEAQLDSDRRRVFQFFTKVMILGKGGILEEEFVRKNWRGGTLEFLGRVMVPMAQAKAEALFEKGAITEGDKKATDELIDEVLAYYKRILGSPS